jgi:FAD/FMN-containing dehydrogenase
MPTRSKLRHGAALCAVLLAQLPAVASAADSGERAESATPFALGLPDKPWRLLVELPGFEMGPVQRPSGSARALGMAERSGLTVSLTLAPSPQDPSARSCRDRDWAGRQKLPLMREDTRLSAEGEQARVEFLVPSIDGEAVHEKHVLLYLQRDGVCAIVHLWKLHYRPEDADALERLLGSVRLG